MPDTLYKGYDRTNNVNSENTILPSNIVAPTVSSEPDNIAANNSLFRANTGITFPDVPDVTAYSKYNIPVTPYNDYNRNRANAQHASEQFFNSLKQMGTTIAGQTVQGVGALGALVTNVASEVEGDNADFNNAMMEWGQSIQDYGSEKAPIYRENPNKTFDVGDWAWWMQNGVSTASSIGLLIPAYAGAELVSEGLNLIGKLGKGINAVNKASKFSRIVADGLVNVGKAAKNNAYITKLGTSAFISRNGENFSDALQTTNQVYNEVGKLTVGQYDDMLSKDGGKLKNDFNESNPGLPLTRENVAKFIAARAGWNVYGMDAGNIVFDAIQMAPLFKGFKPVTRSFLNPSNVVNAVRVEAGKVVMSGTKSFFNNVAYYGTTEFAREGVTEGMEEAVNYMAQQEGSSYAKYLMDNKERPGFGERIAEYSKNPQLWEQAFWGSMGGMVFGGAIHGINAVKETISDSYDAMSSKNRINEITGRKLGIAKTIAEVNLVNNGIDPNTGEVISPDKFDEVKAKVIKRNGDEIGNNAARHGNSDSLIDQYNSPEYVAKLKEGLTTQEEINNVDNTIKILKERAIRAEQNYHKYFSYIMPKNIPENVKSSLIQKAMMYDDMIEESSTTTDDANRIINANLNDNKLIHKLNKDHFTSNNPDASYNGSIDRESLKNLRLDLENENKQLTSIINDPTTNETQKGLAREHLDLNNKAIIETDEKFDAVKDNPGYQKLSESGNVDQLIVANIEKQRGEIQTKIFEKELHTLLNDPKQFADNMVQKLTEARDETVKNIHDPLDKLIDTTSDLDALKQLQKKIVADKQANDVFGDLQRMYKKLTNKVSNKIKDINNATKGVVQTEPTNVDREVIEDKPIVIDEDNEKVVAKEENTLFPTGILISATTNTILLPGTTVELGVELEDNSINPVEASVGDMPDITLEKEAPLGSTTIFNSAMYNIKTPTDDNGVVRLTEEESKQWNELFNVVKEGDTVTIKEDEDQTAILHKEGTRIRTTFETKIGIYTSNNVLLWHLSEVQTYGGIYGQSHLGLIYTQNNSWVNEFTRLIRQGKLDEEITALLQYRRAKINGNNDLEANSLITLHNSELFQELINTNRDSNKLLKDTDEYNTALDHISKVLSYKIALNTLKQLGGISINKESLISSLESWGNIITKDLDNTIKLRTQLQETGSINTKIRYKTPGSFIVNQDGSKTLYSKLNHTVSIDENDLGVGLYMSSNDSPNTLLSINEFAEPNTRSNEEKVVSPGVPYIRLKMGTIDGTPKYKYVKTQITHTGLENIPEDIAEYNEKVLQYLLDTIENSTTPAEVYSKLKDYIAIKAESTKSNNVYRIKTAAKNKRTVYKNQDGSYATKAEYDADSKNIISSQEDQYVEYRLSKDTDGSLKLTSPFGKENLLKNRADLARTLRFKGLFRQVLLTKNAIKTSTISNSKFTDNITGKEYNNYTEFLVDTGAVVSVWGAARDNNNQLISNASAFNTYNNIGQPIVVSIDMTQAISVKQEEPRRKKDITQPYTSLGEYIAAFTELNNIPNSYAEWFKVIDTLGIKFDSSKREYAKDAYAKYKVASNEIILGKRIDTETGVNNHVRFIVHESIHGIIGNNITEEQTQRLNVIRDLVKTKFDEGGFSDLNEEELGRLEGIINETTKSVEEVITYAFTNKVFANALNSIEMDVNGEPKSLARQLLDIILKVIDKVFGNTALTEVTNILEDIILNNNTTTTETNITPDSGTDNTNKKPEGLGDEWFANISDIQEIPSAIDFLRSLNKEERAIARDNINRGLLIFKCR